MTKPKRKSDEKAQKERFAKKARELEADETGEADKTGEAFERAFKKVAKPKKSPIIIRKAMPRPSAVQSSDASTVRKIALPLGARAGAHG